MEGGKVIVQDDSPLDDVPVHVEHVQVHETSYWPRNTNGKAAYGKSWAI